MRQLFITFPLKINSAQKFIRSYPGLAADVKKDLTYIQIDLWPFSGTFFE